MIKINEIKRKLTTLVLIIFHFLLEEYDAIDMF